MALNAQRMYETSFVARRVGAFSNQIWASNDEEAELICLRRRLGETVVRCVTGSEQDYSEHILLPSEHLRSCGWNPACRERSLASAIHAICWLSFVACRARTLEAERLFEEDGVLHNLAHLASNEGLMGRDPATVLDQAIRELEQLERTTPGFAKYRELQVLGSCL